MEWKLERALKEKEAAAAKLQEQTELSRKKNLVGEKQMLAKKEGDMQQQMKRLQGELAGVNKDLGEARELVH